MNCKSCGFIINFHIVVLMKYVNVRDSFSFETTDRSRKINSFLFFNGKQKVNRKFKLIYLSQGAWIGRHFIFFFLFFITFVEKCTLVNNNTRQRVYIQFYTRSMRITRIVKEDNMLNQQCLLLTLM